MRKVFFAAILCVFGLSAAGMNAAASDKMVGPAACGACHKAQYEAWQKGPHAAATTRLPSDAQTDSRCLGCHASDATQGQLAVSCETCHGAGQHYAKSYLMKDRELAKALGLKMGDFSVCQTCHQGQGTRLESFDAKKAWFSLPHSQTRGK